MPQADVVVVGSGAGGATVAGELQRAGASVVLLEAGPQLAAGREWHGRNAFPAEADRGRFAEFMLRSIGPYAGDEPGPRDLPGAGVVHSLGGTMVDWTHNCPDPHPDLERPPELPAGRWDGLVRRARELLSVSTQTTDDGVRQARLLERARTLHAETGGPRAVQPMPRAARRVDGEIRYTASGDLLLGAGPDDPPNLTVIAEHVVRELGARDGRITHVDAYPPGGGERVRFEADRFVVAAGTIGTPKILVASGLDAGPALGRYLMDHPHLGSSVLLPEALLDGVPRDDGAVAIWFPVDHGFELQSEIVQFPFPASMVPEDHDPFARVEVFTTVGTTPRYENRLTFDDVRRDAFGLPRYDAEFSLSDEDRERLFAAAAEHARIVTGIAGLEGGWGVTLLRQGESTHLMGTHRLGAQDDGESVVDVDGRMWRYENLWLAGNGVLNRWNACNPTLTNVTVALGTADAMRR